MLTNRPIVLNRALVEACKKQRWPLASLRLPTGTSFGRTKGLVLEAAEPVEGSAETVDEIHLFLVTCLPVDPSVVRRVVRRLLKKGKIWAPAAAALKRLPDRTYGTFSCTARFGLKPHPAVPLVFLGRNVWCPHPVDELRVFDLSKVETRFLSHLEKTIKPDLLRLRKRAFQWSRVLWHASSCLAVLEEKVWDESQRFNASFRRHGQFCVCEVCILLRRASPTD